MINIEKRRKIYKTCNTEKIKIKEIEKCLNLIWSKITYHVRGKRCSTIDVRFENESTARKRPTAILKGDEWNLLPLYMDRGTFKIRINKFRG